MSDEPYRFGPDNSDKPAPVGPVAGGAGAGAWGAPPEQPRSAAPDAAPPIAAAPDAAGLNTAGPDTAGLNTAGLNTAWPDSAESTAAGPVITGTDGAGPDGVRSPWGGKSLEAPRQRMSTMAKSLTAVGVAAVIAVGGTVAVTSANADNSSAAASSAGQPMGGEGFGTVGGTGADGVGSAMGSGGFGGGSAGRSLIAGALHGEFVVSSGTGTVTERLQTGSITALTSTSVTVKSTDAYTATYVVPSGVDVSSLANGSTVTVIATVAGSTLTVVSISSVSVTAGGRGMSSGGGTGGFTPPDGSAPGGAGSGAVGGIGGSGSGHSGSTGAGSGSAGTATDTGI